MMFNTFPFGRWPVAFDALFALIILMGSNGSEGRRFRDEGGRALVLFGFGSVWLRDLSMQLCFGFASDVFAKLHIYLIRARLLVVELLELLKLHYCLLENDTHIKPPKTIHVLPYAAEFQTALPCTSIQYY